MKIKEIQKCCSTYIAVIRLQKEAEKEKNLNKQISLRLHILTFDILPKHQAPCLFKCITLTKKKELYRTCAYLIREYFKLIQNHEKKLSKQIKSVGPKLKKLLK